MSSDGAKRRFPPRFGLRGMAILLAVIAVPLAVLTPFARERLRRSERIVRVRIEIDRHLREGRNVAEEFVRAVRSGRLSDAEQLTTVGLQRASAQATFQGLIKAGPLCRGPCELINGFISYSDEQGRLVSEYDFRCSSDENSGTLAKLLLVIESGHLKVDHIEYAEGAR